MSDRSICNRPGAQCDYKHTDICIICGRARHWRERGVNPHPTQCHQCGMCFSCGMFVGPTNGMCNGDGSTFDGCAVNIIGPLAGGPIEEMDEVPVCSQCGLAWPVDILDKIKVATDTWNRPETPAITKG